MNEELAAERRALRKRSRAIHGHGTPDATAEVAFTGDLGTTGINKDGGYYRTAFMGFGAERLFSPSDLQNALSTFFGWCDGLSAVDGDADGVPGGG